jgi:hypothetical protein
MTIQPWHDLETLFISFTALCVWFQLPYCAKEAESGFDWIFEPHKDNDPEAVHRKWQRFQPDFESSIIGNLSSYFKCPAIVDLLTTMRDKCFPPLWEGKASDPSGYRWPDGVKRVTHKDMLEAVEQAILALLKEDNQDRLHRQDFVENWFQAHAYITDDGIFSPPPAMSTNFPAMVVDAVNSPKGLVMSGIFDRVRPVKPDINSEPAYSGPITFQSTMSSARTEVACSNERAFRTWLLQPRQAKRLAAPSGVDDIYFQPPKPKTPRLQ